MINATDLIECCMEKPGHYFDTHIDHQINSAFQTMMLLLNKKTKDLRARSLVENNRGALDRILFVKLAICEARNEYNRNTDE